MVATFALYRVPVRVERSSIFLIEEPSNQLHHHHRPPLATQVSP
jgi:hypothetical protein